MSSSRTTGSIIIPLEPRIQNYEKQLQQLKQSIDKIGRNTTIGQDLARQFVEITGRVEELGKKVNQRFTSDLQIDRLGDQFRDIDERVKTLGQTLQSVNNSDLNLKHLSQSTQDAIKNFQQLSQQVNTALTDDLQKSLQASPDIQKLFAAFNVDIDTVTIENWQETFDKILQESEGRVASLDAKINQLNRNIARYNTIINDNKPLDVAQETQKVTNGVDLTRITELDANKVDSFKNSILKTVEGLTSDPNLKSTVEAKLAALFSLPNYSSMSTELSGLTTYLSQELSKAGTKVSQSAIRTGLEQEFKAVFPASSANEVLNIEFFKQGTNELTTLEANIKTFLDALPGLEEGSKEYNRLLNELLNSAKQNDASAFGNLLAQKIAEFNKTLDQITNDAKQRLQQEEAKIAQAETDKLQQEAETSRVKLATRRVRLSARRINASHDQELVQVAEARTKADNAVAAELQDTRNVGGQISGEAQRNLTDLNNQLNIYKGQLEQVQAREKLVGNLQHVVDRWFSIYAVINSVKRAISSVISTVRELDKTITEIAIVTDMSQKDLWSQMSSYTDMARQYGTSISGVYTVSQLFYQQGLQTAEVMQLTEQTLKMARISGLDYATATDYMTNAIRSFKMEMGDAQRVVDVYSAIAAKSATDTAELAVAMSKTASSAEAVGSSFENTTAMMAVMIEATRESSQNIGSALKSIISRYGEMTSDPSKLVDSEGEEMSLNRVDKALQTVGISIHNAAGEFKDFDDVITELAGKWDTIDTNTKRYIATIMA